jgi:hypothetical protein
MILFFLWSQFQKSVGVIPAKAGIQHFQNVLDTGFCRCGAFN